MGTILIQRISMIYQLCLGTPLRAGRFKLWLFGNLRRLRLAQLTLITGGSARSIRSHLGMRHERKTTIRGTIARKTSTTKSTGRELDVMYGWTIDSSSIEN